MRMQLTWERKLLAMAGYGCLAGVDEVGRGAWAGPLMAAAVLIKPTDLGACATLTRLVRDSKSLNPKQRARAYIQLTERLQWGIGTVSARELDEVGMTAANQRVLERALAALNLVADYVLVDGRGFCFNRPHRQVVGGDRKIFCIAAASIIAKVTRDRWMERLHIRYPRYGFGRHKGYGTSAHRTALHRFGPCPIHRRSFRPVGTALAELGIRNNEL